MRAASTLLIVALAAVAVSADYATKTVTAKKPNAYESIVFYFEFSKTHPLTTVINPVLKEYATGDQKRWVKQTEEDLKQGNPSGTTWSQEIEMSVVRNTRRLVSVISEMNGYSGGAHGYAFTRVFNFGMVDGKAKQLKLADFFQKGYNPGPAISKLVIAKLKKEEGAEWVHSGEFKKMEPVQLERFTVGGDGLTWHFNQYEVGPYVAGTFTVKLTAKELGPKFKKEMLK